MTFTDQQLYHIYNCIVSADDAFIKGLAKAAIRTAIDIQTDMFLEYDDTDPVPDNNDIREQAHSFADVTVEHFGEQLVKAIKEVKFDANIKHHRVMKTDLQFVD